MSAPPLFSRSGPAVRRLRLLELPRQISTSQEHFSGAGIAPPAQGQARSLRSAHCNRWASLPQFDQARVAVLRSVRSPGGGVASVPLALYVRASSVQSVKSCHSASTFTRAPGRPQVRQGFWPLGSPSQAALPHATLLFLAVDQHFSGASFTLAGLRFCG
ncbi:hypothetical protein NDU88_007024 [Pleurodeles waltl]|uniref:Uncharacterized protein n=1 Tax=Pleurodeles waltl TaxID=8319 RepID=A0AAV7UPH9_PLEWA|nr:hypothetical protein NDU88_007024 [Pleurodeles waltl]